jgi:hypothetical protein
MASCRVLIAHDALRPPTMSHELCRELRLALIHTTALLQQLRLHAPPVHKRAAPWPPVLSTQSAHRATIPPLYSTGYITVVVML